jgi:cofilin
LSVADNLNEKFHELKVRRKFRYLTIEVGETLIDVEKLGEPSASYDDMKKALPFSDCRYAVYDHEYNTADRGMQHKLWFICWFPDNATTYNKMAYTAAKTQTMAKMAGVSETLVRSLEELDEALGVQVEESDSDIDL